MERVCFLLRVKPERLDEYRARHREVWDSMLTALRDNGWLAPDALVAVERATRGGPVRWPAGYAESRARRYGEGTLWYGHAAGH